MKMKSATISFFLCLSVLRGYAQQGDFFVTNYSPEFQHIEHLYFDMVFSSTEEMIAANKAGVLKFDGNDWNFVPTPSSALSLALDTLDRIYVGCAEDFGKVAISRGEYRFEPFNAQPLDGIVTQTLYHKGMVYFLQENKIHIYDTRAQEIRQTVVPDTGYFELMFEFEDDIYLQGSSDLYQLSDSSLIRIDPFLPDGGHVAICSWNAETNEYAIGSSTGRVYVYDGAFFEKDIPRNIVIADIAWTSRDHFGVSTYSRGIIFFDMLHDKVFGTIAGGRGLADNEIFAISSDQKRGLWVANSFGFTRIAPEIPIKTYNYYPGLEGSLMSVVPKEDTWLVSTSTGVYFFDEEKKYKNKVYYIRKDDQPSVGRSKVQKKEPILKLRNPFGGKKPLITIKRPELFDDDDEPGLIHKIFKGDKDQSEYIRTTRRVLLSSEYIYRPIDGLNEKSRKLLDFQDRFLCLAPSGIFEIRDSVATQIYDEPVRTMYRPEGEPMLLASTLAGEVKMLELEEDIWIESASLEIPGDQVMTIARAGKNAYWLAGATHLYRVSFDSLLRLDTAFAIENQYFDEIRIASIRDRLYLINDQGYFYLDRTTGKVVRDNEFQSRIGVPVRHLQQNNGRVWVQNGEDWYRINSDGSLEQFAYLKLFPDMSFIDEIDDDLWLIDNHELLYKYSPGEADSISSGAMFVREVRSRGDLIPAEINDLRFDYHNSSVHFEMSRPDYLGLLNIEYRYLLDGRNSEWSDWTKNNHIDLAYLPPGKFMLRIQSRDIFNRQQESAPISITVSPPYWETAWFSAAEVMFFALLVLISARLNRAAGGKPTIVTNLLTIVTIVMIIELLQNVAGSYFGELATPVLAFAIDVFVALLVFPIEQLLRKVVQGKPVKGVNIMPVGKS